MALDSTSANLVALLPSCALLILYHFYLFRVVRQQPGRTVYGLTRAARRVWVAAIMYRKNEILAVQSLRNWVMASSFLATTAILMVTTSTALLGSLAVNWTPTTLSSPISYAVGFVQDSWFPARFACLLVTLMLAFFAFAQSVRFFNHAALICNVNISEEELTTFMKQSGPYDPSTPSPPSVLKSSHDNDPNPMDSTLHAYRYLRSNPTHVAAVLNRGCFYYTAGMRCYYLCFPIIFWFWGPIPLGAATVALVIGLRLIDFHIEDFEENDKKKEGSEQYPGMRASGWASTLWSRVSGRHRPLQSKRGQQLSTSGSGSSVAEMALSEEGRARMV
ncbi:hypothetical protein DFS34DRAFT_609589 [Phlyctochytrium arcticum]|nr:hypothetical protein DFS34DRAFT_609589 [Phlyctochytrium arcticum]